MVVDLLDRKGRTVHTIEPDKNLVECADRMTQANVGALVVVDGERALAGIVTYRDILRSLAEGADPGHTTVQDVMMKGGETTTEATTLKDAEAKMLAAGIRHLPVLREREVVGIVTRIDVLKLHLQQVNQLSDDLIGYIGGAYR
jgi:CBS domain-containing protein